LKSTDYFLLSKSTYKPSLFYEMITLFDRFREAMSSILEDHYRKIEQENS
jgi:hypothetical protein